MEVRRAAHTPRDARIIERFLGAEQEAFTSSSTGDFFASSPRTRCPFDLPFFTVFVSKNSGECSRARHVRLQRRHFSDFLAQKTRKQFWFQDVKLRREFRQNRNSSKRLQEYRLACKRLRSSRIARMPPLLRSFSPALSEGLTSRRGGRNFKRTLDASFIACPRLKGLSKCNG